MQLSICKHEIEVYTIRPLSDVRASINYALFNVSIHVKQLGLKFRCMGPCLTVCI